MPIIAEIGSNHEGDTERAKDLILAAKDAGADIAKFQLFKPQQFPQNIALDERTMLKLKECCENLHIGFLMSVFYVPKFLGEFNLGFVKIAYSQRHNFSLIKSLLEEDIRLIVSGDQWTLFPERSIHLACVPKYPADPKDYDFLNKPNLSMQFDGVSDHTVGIDFILSLKSKNPWIIEKHLKLGDEKKSLDAGKFAVLPDQFRAMVKAMKS